MVTPSSVIKLSNFPVTLPVIPPNYPAGPAPGKIALLLNSNDNYLYNKFSPYTNYQSDVLSGILSNQQPFVYTHINDAENSVYNHLPTSVKALTSIANITPDTVDDVVRISKFLISSWGVQFLITQAAMQRLASFDETRIYNPLSPILATVEPLTLGLGTPPTRHIEGGFLGLLDSVTSTVGINLESGYQTPSSTAGNAALPPTNTGQGKGLIRGTDAARGLTSFKSKWGAANTPSTGISGFLSTVGSAFNSLFGNPQKLPQIFRADDEGYQTMANSRLTRSPDGGPIINQAWFASAIEKVDAINTDNLPVLTNKSAVGIVLAKPNGDTTFKKVKLISYPNYFGYIDTSNGLIGPSIIGTVSDGLGNNNSAPSAPTGYPVGDKYGDVVGQQTTANATDLTNSDMLVQYAFYTQEGANYPTKLSNNQSKGVTQINATLQQVINKINLAPVYVAINSPASYLLPGGGYGAQYIEYDNWTTKQQGAKNPGAAGEYASGRSGPAGGSKIPTIDAFVSTTNNLRMATAFMSDGINQLGIINGKTMAVGNTSYPGWTEWRPYNDDLIAFYFYDVVNDKYIPFRATVKGISEGNTAFWDELRFIGRADQLYSYNGFSRTLSFTFNVVISSVSELLPSWKKINYMASVVKPSNYTIGQNINQQFNRFIIPPMFMLTIGDLYKFQPIVITSLNVNIPEDASWETLNEDNSKQQGWTYLQGLIQSPSVGLNYGQLPKEAEIAITCNLLEKERAILGGSHFGHEPRRDDWEKYTNINDMFVTSSANVPYLPFPTTLHTNFVELNNHAIPSNLTDPTVPKTPAQTRLGIGAGGNFGGAGAGGSWNSSDNTLPPSFTPLAPTSPSSF